MTPEWFQIHTLTDGQGFHVTTSNFIPYEKNTDQLHLENSQEHDEPIGGAIVAITQRTRMCGEIARSIGKNAF